MGEVEAGIKIKSSVLPIFLIREHHDELCNCYY